MTPDVTTPENLRTGEVCDFLRISPSTLRRLRKRPDFPRPHFPTSWPVWKRADLEAWRASRTAPQAA